MNPNHEEPSVPLTTAILTMFNNKSKTSLLETSHWDTGVFGNFQRSILWHDMKSTSFSPVQKEISLVDYCRLGR